MLNNDTEWNSWGAGSSNMDLQRKSALFILSQSLTNYPSRKYINPQLEIVPSKHSPSWNFISVSCFKRFMSGGTNNKKNIEKLLPYLLSGATRQKAFVILQSIKKSKAALQTKTCLFSMKIQPGMCACMLHGLWIRKDIASIYCPSRLCEQENSLSQSKRSNMITMACRVCVCVRGWWK